MRSTLVAGLLSILVGAAWATSSPAGWLVVRAPFVDVRVGSGVSVQAPFVDVRVGPPAERMIVAPPPVAVRAPTLEEFAASFRPAPGNYEVTILHSRSCCPVTICFTLPPGCPKVCLQKHQLDFQYPCEDVRIRCRIGGKVKVSYH
jgi:hypothetical protein